MLGHARQAVPGESIAGKAISCVGVSAAQAEAVDRSESESHLSTIVVCLPRVAKEGASTDFSLLDNRVGHAAQEERHGIAQARERLSSSSYFVIHGSLGTELRVEASRPIRLVHQLGGSRCLE